MYTQDANGHFVTNVYDSMGRLQFVKNALGENARQHGYDLPGRNSKHVEEVDVVLTTIVWDGADYLQEID